ncbi:glycoside hydrolase family 99-like domain-containing protein [Anaerolineales bacterium HSG6]|nr:glycoside hydrolase family 99-like domain-containing protein [Anaerolineales bacterium HSG6]
MMNKSPSILDWRILFFNALVMLCAGCMFVSTLFWLKGPPLISLAPTPTTLPVSTKTPVPTFTATPWFFTATPTATPGIPTPTSTPVVQNDQANFSSNQSNLDRTTERQAGLGHLSTMLGQQTLPITRIGHGGFGKSSRLVLAHYFAWFSGTGWNDCNMSAGDKPLQPYDSSDPTAIARHIGQALQIGLDGFTVHWFVPGGPTDRNFAELLNQSQNQPFYSTVVFSRHIYHGGNISQQSVSEALRHIIERHSSHANFLRMAGKPVIFFTDIHRVPTRVGQSPQQFWSEVRHAVDPQKQTMWIAEGLDFSYLSEFNGQYVFKITHTTSVNDYRKNSSWANKVRQAGDSKLWVATISPGWDDLSAGCKADVREPAPPHRVNRADGAYFQATFDAAQQSDPDWLIVGSFNEWVEGSYIEPGLLYGDRYMGLTKQLVREFKTGR